MSSTKMGKVALDNRYWYGVGNEMVRVGLATEVAPRTFEVKLPLPEKDVLEKLVLQKLYTRTLEDWYEDAKGDADSLKDEMTEWRDNMDGSGLENTSKFEEVQSAADSLEAQELPEVPESLKSLPVTVHPGVLVISARHRQKKQRTGRSWRHGEVLGILEAIKDRVRSHVEELQEKDKRTSGEGERIDEAEEFEQEVSNYTDEVEGVDFPGMF